ncbi:MAG: hypothetical protein ACI8TX_001434 [Hyphomicrobiaceae bacterium]|jgi:hypothetical protein
MILEDPDNPGDQIVYLALYDRALAIGTDGTVVWDVPTGLTLPVDLFSSFVLGVNYIPSIDGLAMVTSDGRVVLLDRATGAQLQSAPLELPGAPSVDLPSPLTPQLLADSEVEVQALMDLPEGGFDKLINILLGQDREVSNMFSVDPATSRVWLAATAPDAEDGVVDGVSEVGALFRLDVVTDGAGFTLAESCHAYFDGGTASTPTVSNDGSHIYVGDSAGKLLAIDATDCSTAWEVDLGEQIVGSVAAASDNDELYASTLNFIFKVTDDGNDGTIVWQATLDKLFQSVLSTQEQFNMNLIAVAPNGLYFQAGVGRVVGTTQLPVAVGVGVLDRETGEVRHFIGGAEETVAVMSTGPDGALYVGNSPVRRAISIAFGDTSGPLRGGITKFAAPQSSLVVRESACAAVGRIPNATDGLGVCGTTAEAEELGQLDELVAQATLASAAAVLDESLKSKDAVAIDERLAIAAVGVAAGDASGYADAHGALASVCTELSADLSRTKLVVVQKVGGKAKLVYVSKNKGTAIDKGTAHDLETISVSFEYGWGTAEGSFDVPVGAASGWLLNEATKAKYKNNAADAGVPTGVASVGIVTGKVVKLKAKTTGDVANDLIAAGEPTGSIATRFSMTNGGVEHVYCTRFLLGAAKWKEIAGGTGRKLLALKGVPVTCN